MGQDEKMNTKELYEENETSVVDIKQENELVKGTHKKKQTKEKIDPNNYSINEKKLKKNHVKCQKNYGQENIKSYENNKNDVNGANYVNNQLVDVHNITNKTNVDKNQNKDIIHVLLVASLFSQKIIDLLMVNKYMYIDCTQDELNFIKCLGIQILSHLYKEGFIQSSKISPSIFCLCFSPDIKLKSRSEKVINCIIEKENYNFLNNLAECLQYLLFYIIENNYMYNNRESNNINNLFLFNKIESSFFKTLLDIYENLTSKKLKIKYLKIILKEIENTCHFILYDKIKKFIRETNGKYNNNNNNNNSSRHKVHSDQNKNDDDIYDCNNESTIDHSNNNNNNNNVYYNNTNIYNNQDLSKNVMIHIYPINQIYSYIINTYIILPNNKTIKKNGKSKKIKEITTSSLSSYSSSYSSNSMYNKDDELKNKKNNENNKNKKKNKRSKHKDLYYKEKTQSSKDDSSVTENIYDNDNYQIRDCKDIMEKIRNKYNYLLKDYYMKVDEYIYINYFLFLYLQILINLISYLNFSTYNEIAILIHDINKLYCIISSTIHMDIDADDFSRTHEESFFTFNEHMKQYTSVNDINVENEDYMSINLNLNKVKCFVMAILNNLTNNLIKHYDIDTSKLNELIEEDNIKENKIEDEKREEPKNNIFNYMEYIYECIEIFIEDNNTIVEKYSKCHLNIHNLNNDYINKLINDGKNKKFVQKKKQKETAKQRRLTLKRNN